jgi:hypothetical protein
MLIDGLKSAISNVEGRLAQPVEQLTLNQRVAGSIPASPIQKISQFFILFFDRFR